MVIVGQALTLGTDPIEVRGTWHVPKDTIRMVLYAIRNACLAGLAIRSDRQPRQIWVDNHESGPPSVWLHTYPQDVSWIIVDVGDRDWSRLAYQFGHELGHVLCNSWQADAAPQWLEEALVEAFSLRGLGNFADAWLVNPPFAGTADFGSKIRAYRNVILSRYQDYAASQNAYDLPVWLRTNGAALAKATGMTELVESIVPRLLGEIERDPSLIEDYSALNRWPDRSGVELQEYLRLWKVSSSQVGGPGRLPDWLDRQFGS
jgi:hypothetical protein